MFEKLVFQQIIECSKINNYVYLRVPFSWNIM